MISAPPASPIPWVVAEFEAGSEAVESPEPTEMFSTHPGYVDALRHDPLVYRGPLPKETVRALIRTWPEVAAAAAEGRPSIPVLLVHGGSDPVVPVENSMALVEQLPQAVIRVIPGDLHDVLNEHDRDAVHEIVAEFVRTQVGRDVVRA